MSKIFEPIHDFSTPPNNPIDVYTNLTSVAQGETINFHVSIDTNESSYPFTVEIWRYEETQIYVTTLNGSSFRQPTNADPDENGCGWSPSLGWVVPNDLPSGVYKAIVSAVNFGFTKHIFVNQSR